jgi:hypothetical protein
MTMAASLISLQIHYRFIADFIRNESVISLRYMQGNAQRFMHILGDIN